MQGGFGGSRAWGLGGFEVQGGDDVSELEERKAWIEAVFEFEEVAAEKCRAGQGAGAEEVAM